MIARILIAATFAVTLSTVAFAQGSIAEEARHDCDDRGADALAVELRELIAPDLDRLAQDLSRIVAESNLRDSIVKHVLESKGRTLGLGQLIADLKSREGGREGGELARLDESVRKIESLMSTTRLESPQLNLKIPVARHAEALAGRVGEVYVAIAPLADEKDQESITAYSKGESIRLDPAAPPEVPTLVIAGDEPHATDPGYPIATANDAGKEDNPRVVDDYIGIPMIYMYNDHESWTCGDPEVYVRVKRFRFSTFSLVNEKFNLPGVNGERVWYNLGDWNSTYRYVSTSNYAPVIRLEFWEADSGFHGSDDYMGAINIWWTGLSFNGYATYTAGDIRFQIDRD